MRRKYNNPKLKFYLGDVRDYHSLTASLHGVDYVFHAAALKQVPSCEFYPLESVKTNILGTENVLEASHVCGVKRVVVLSTDKAVYPINAMGISKAMMEKVAVAKSRTTTNTIINVTRYGNVMGSRGSVIPLFASQCHTGVPLTITDPSMTRFMMTLDDAVDLVLYAFKHGNPGEIYVQKAPAASIEVLATAVLSTLGKRSHPISVIGTRHGEKLYEVLLTREEMQAAQDLGEYFCIPPDLRDLNYSNYFERGEASLPELTDYNSHNTTRLTIEQMTSLLKKSSCLDNQEHHY